MLSTTNAQTLRKVFLSRTDRRTLRKIEKRGTDFLQLLRKPRARSKSVKIFHPVIIARKGVKNKWKGRTFFWHARIYHRSFPCFSTTHVVWFSTKPQNNFLNYY